MPLPVRTVYNKSWIPYENKVEFYLSSDFKFDAPVTTVHGFFFNKDKKLLLVHHVKRGWEVPGGHVEKGEDFRDAMSRELFEEAQMHSTELHQLGYLKKVALEDRPEHCLYPHPLSYCIFYRGLIDGMEKFEGDDSITDASFFALDAAEKTPWLIAYKEFFKAAVDLI